MRRFLSAIAALALAAASLPAPAQSADTANITAFTVENVSSIITEVGGTKIEVNKDADVTFINFELGGHTYSYSIRTCDISPEVPGCLGLLMAIGYGMEPPYSLETFNGFNQVFPLVTAVKIDSKTLAFGRYVFSAGGLTRNNIAANMGLVIGAPQAFASYLKSQVIASGAPGNANLSLAGAATQLRPVKLTRAQVRGLLDDTIVRSNLQLR